MTFQFSCRPLLVAAMLALSACSYGPSGGDLGSAQMTQVVDELPAPVSANPAMAGAAYTIGPYDRLMIGVFGVEGMEPREIVADSAGRISFPLAGSIMASGRSPDEIAAIITDRLRANYVRSPNVTVNLIEPSSQLVNVDGQVKMPGVYPVTAQMTLMRAIAAARGLDEFAKAEEVVVLRTVGDRRYAGLYNLAAIQRGNYADPNIHAGDTVIVGESRQRRIFKDLLQIVPLLTTPIIVALQR